MAQKEKQVISRKRVEEHGEVLTARREVDAMLDLVKQETERIDSRFLEPACGNGNFLIAILERKLAVIERQMLQKQKHLKKSEKRIGWNQHDYELLSLKALSSIYGIDILADSIEAAINRLLSYYADSYLRIVGIRPSEQILSTARFILRKNILLGDAINTHEKVAIPGIPGLDQIIFTEWGFPFGDMVKRREFRFDSMEMDGKDADNSDKKGNSQLELFAKEEPQTTDVIKTDEGKDILKPQPVREYPLVHYLELGSEGAL